MGTNLIQDTVTYTILDMRINTHYKQTQMILCMNICSLYLCDVGFHLQDTLHERGFLLRPIPRLPETSITQHLEEGRAELLGVRPSACRCEPLPTREELRSRAVRFTDGLDHIVFVCFQPLPSDVSVPSLVQRCWYANLHLSIVLLVRLNLPLGRDSISSWIRME